MSQEGENKKLNLGCGRDIREGWINVDWVKLPGVDVVADLDNCKNVPLPFEDDSIDLFLCSHVLEHLRNPLDLMQELHRIAKPGAQVTIHVPYGSSDDAYEDPTHVRQYFMQSFGYFSQPYYWRADYGYRGDWEIESILLSVNKNLYEAKDYGKIFGDINRLRNVVVQMEATLKAVKPIREPLRELLTPPPVRIILV